MVIDIQVFVISKKEKTGVDRLSLRQAVIFICATNRPDELDLEFVRPGRIDRHLYIGLPDAKQRVHGLPVAWST
ncbi:ATP-dependent zinc metalloprotease FTSH 12, chloroplastic [Sarracenia purpurea var. burkii]